MAELFDFEPRINNDQSQHSITEGKREIETDSID